MTDERHRDPLSDDPQVADNPRSTGGPEAIGDAASEPDYDQPRKAPSTTARRLGRDEFPEGPEKTQG
jgi:hypothetical protein